MENTPLKPASKMSPTPIPFEIDEGKPLTASAEAAALEMQASGAGGFAIVAGRGEQVSSFVRVGGIKADTQYPIASASKWLAAALIMRIVEEHQLSLDTPISEWLGDISEDASALTLRHLLSQTSGLAGSQGEFYDISQDHRITLAESAAQVMSMPLISTPGEVFAYGGPGFQVAGAVVEAVTGKRWAHLFQEYLAAPLEMNHTYWTHLQLASADELPLSETLNPVLQGGAVSCAGDYARFLSMIAQGGVFRGSRLLSEASVDAMLSDQTADAHMTPTGANVLADAHYSLGSWCEAWGDDGRCIRNSSIGLFGMYPWVERGSQQYGMIFLYQREDAFRFWPQMETIRDSFA